MLRTGVDLDDAYQDPVSHYLEMQLEFPTGSGQGDECWP